MFRNSIISEFHRLTDGGGTEKIGKIYDSQRMIMIWGYIWFMI